MAEVLLMMFPHTGPERDGHRRAAPPRPGGPRRASHGGRVVGQHVVLPSGLLQGGVALGSYGRLRSCAS